MLNFVYILILNYLLIILFKNIYFRIQNKKLDKLITSIKTELDDVKQGNLDLNEYRKNKLTKDIEFLIKKTYNLTKNI